MTYYQVLMVESAIRTITLSLEAMVMGMALCYFIMRIIAAIQKNRNEDKKMKAIDARIRNLLRVQLPRADFRSFSDKYQREGYESAISENYLAA